MQFHIHYFTCSELEEVARVKSRFSSPQCFQKQTAYEIRLYTTAFDVLHITGIWQPLLPGDAILF